MIGETVSVPCGHEVGYADCADRALEAGLVSEHSESAHTWKEQVSGSVKIEGSGRESLKEDGVGVGRDADK